MKNKNNSNIKSRLKAWFYSNLNKKILIINLLIMASAQNPVLSQTDLYTEPSWWFGVAGGANANFYQGSTQELNSDLTAPAVFHDGNGLGLYVAPLVEFHRPNTRLGAMLQVGYDNRKGTFDEVKSPCNCPADLETNISYITVEPSLRFAPFRSNFYLFGGPRIAFGMDKSFQYDLGVNPAVPTQTPITVKGDLSNMNSTIISMQVGAGYDIPLSSKNRRTQFVLSPFVSYHPYFGAPRSIETMNITTFRVGAAFKFGRGHKITPVPTEEEMAIIIPAIIPVNADVLFYVNSPRNTPVEKRVIETFPIRNYVFFDLGSTEIPNRYVLLTKNEVKDFKQDQLGKLNSQAESDRSERGMIVYYNILNILGDRMQENPSTTIILVGSSEKGQNDGKLMAESIKNYLVDVFAINPSRITIEGRNKPKIPSEKTSSTQEFVLLREGDRRVSIESSSPILLMEFETGSTNVVQYITINPVEKAPLESSLSINAIGAKEALSSWSVEIIDATGKVQNFGPYTEENVSISEKSILGAKSQGNYKVRMIGKTLNGNVISKDTTIQVILLKETQREESMRFSVIFEFNESNMINMYKKYLTDVVTPKIPKNGTVIIHGHTDIIGNAVYNEKLSKARADEVSRVMKSALLKAGRKDVTFKVDGFGENQSLAPFQNKFPEERFYNRTVIIDIMPKY